MPSDTTSAVKEAPAAPSLTDEIQAVFHEQATAFRSSLALTVEEVRSALATGPAGEHDDATQEAELGRFGSGRIDAGRFNALLDQTLTLDPDDAAHMKAAFESLKALSARSETLFTLTLPPRGCLHDLVARALEDIGRAFGAARVVQASRTGRYSEAEHGPLLEGLRFKRWNRAERRVCPPLVVELEGGDLNAGGLAEFLDGNAKIVLVVKGDAPAAPLARLIAPQTFVLQTTDVGKLKALAAYEGPGIAALLPEAAAQFTHKPLPGSTLAKRLKISHLPGEAPRPLTGGLSASQQAEDLGQLEALSERVVPQKTPADRAAEAATSKTPTPADDPAGKLAAWLLSQAEPS